MRIGLLNVFKSLQSTNLKTMKEGIETLLIDDGNTLTNKPMVPMVHFQSTKQMAAFPMDKNDYPPLLHHQASHPSFTHESSHCACFKRREMTFSHPCAASKKGTSTLVPQVDIIFVKWKCQKHDKLERLAAWMRCLELCQFPQKFRWYCISDADGYYSSCILTWVPPWCILTWVPPWSPILST